MGIKGVNIKQELKTFTKGLPSTFHQAAQQLQLVGVSDACTHYAAFVSASLSSDGSSSQSATELLPAIYRIRGAHLEEDVEPDQEGSSASEQTWEMPGASAKDGVADSADSSASTKGQEVTAGMQRPSSPLEGSHLLLYQEGRLMKCG